MFIERLTIIGVGLIGGSLARALKRAGVVGHITGYGREEANLRRGVELGVIDSYSLELSAAVRAADVVVLATPLATTEGLLREMASSLRKDVIITDVGSAKGSVVAAARRSLDGLFPRFVPGHPVAGTERSGVQASFSELFDGHLVILTPVEQTDAAALTRVRELWEHCRARVITLDVAYHDRVLAATSHLPHMLAYALVDCLAEMQESEEIFNFAAGGFRDFSRIASSSPEMWHDVCFANRESLLAVLEDFESHLLEIKQAISNSNGEQLYRIFKRAKQARDGFVHKRGGEAAIDTSE